MLTERFTFALHYATHVHATQKRKATEVPYISHLLGVASLVLEHGGNEDEAIGALLHDAMEDQNVTEDELVRLFGATVAAIVVGCTDGVPDSETGEKPPWRQRKEKYVAHLSDVKPNVLLVSAADKLYNARAILADYRTHNESLWNRFSGGRESLWYYRALADQFLQLTEENAAPGLRALAAELDRTVQDLERLADDK